VVRAWTNWKPAGDTGTLSDQYLDYNSSPPGRGKQQEHRGWVEQQRHHEKEPSEDRLVVGAEQHREVTRRAKVSIDGAALALRRGLLERAAASPRSHFTINM
jgi:hypothetical protein